VGPALQKEQEKGQEKEKALKLLHSMADLQELLISMLDVLRFSDIYDHDRDSSYLGCHGYYYSYSIVTSAAQQLPIAR
jgi:hypothetical protein